MSCGCLPRPLSISPSANFTYFAWYSISVISEEISTKPATNIHHTSTHTAEKLFTVTGKRSRSQPWRGVKPHLFYWRTRWRWWWWWHECKQLTVSTSGAISDFPISSKINANSTFVSPAPWRASGSVLRVRNRFHRPSDLAISWQHNIQLFHSTTLHKRWEGSKCQKDGSLFEGDMKGHAEEGHYSDYK